MRQPMLFSAVFCLLAAAPAFAQSYAAVILQKDVEVRSGPSKTFYPTSKLNQNDKVLVLREAKEAPGWLEIMPPPGSFSWVNSKFVKFATPGDRLGVVDADLTRPVSFLPGSVLVNQEPNRESVKVMPGTIVELLERPLTVGGETWLPVKPHSSEVRYIPAEAVKASTVVTAASTGPANWTLTPNGYVKDPVLAEADKELAAGNRERAKQLYLQVANTSVDQNNKRYAQDRYASLQNPTVPATTTSLSPANPLPGPGVAAQMLKAAEWSTYGRLRDTKLPNDNGLPLYALEDGRGGLPIYITTVPGKSLQTYLGRWVSVYGPTMYRPDVRMQYVVASHVAVP